MEKGNHGTLVTSVREVLYKLYPLSSSCCIYRVPKRQRRVSEKAYTPQVVSIGPLHHGKEDLKAMEEYKNRYLQAFLERTTLSLKDCIIMIQAKEETLRGCYAETIEFSSDEFVRIILVDAAFIIEVLFRYCFPDSVRDQNDRIFNKPWMLQDVWPDMRMLENQLPFFILNDLFDPDKITFPPYITESQRPSIIDLSHHFFKNLMHIEVMEDTLDKIRSSHVEVEHFVDFCRKLYPPPLSQSQDRRKLETLTTPSVTELHQAGVRLQVGSNQKILDIRFSSNGILEIPKLTISDQTEVTITNLLVFEQSECKDEEKYINDYFVIMNSLVKTREDVELLVRHGILENKLGDNRKGCTLIKNLADGVVESKDYFYFVTLCENLNKYYSMPRHKWKWYLRKHFFNSPWATKEIIAAVILLVLTLIQTVCSIISACQAQMVLAGTRALVASTKKGSRKACEQKICVCLPNYADFSDLCVLICEV